MTGSIRIIGGKWRGRKLPVLTQTGLRPTTDRNKETLFNWLMPIIHDANCLDCFAGSGSLGFEAGSRGAQQVILLEKESAAVKQLQQNKTRLNSESLIVKKVDTLTWLANKADMQFDIVFIDPPFHHSIVAKTISLLESNNWLKNSAYIYIETELNLNVLDEIPANWYLHREKVSGQVCYRLFIREKN